MNLFTLPTEHDGITYDINRDRERLTTLRDRVREYMQDKRWHTLTDIQAACGGSETGTSAKLRDLRKPQHGGHEIHSRRVGGGVWEYRMGGDA